MNHDGIFIFYSSFVSVINSTIANCSQGLNIQGSSNVNIINCTLTDNLRGICISHSSNLMLQGNLVRGSIWNEGILVNILFKMSNIIIHKNNISENYVGIEITLFNVGFNAESENFTVSNNTISLNIIGIKIKGSVNVTLSENNITDNEQGLLVVNESDPPVSFLFNFRSFTDILQNAVERLFNKKQENTRGITVLENNYLRFNMLGTYLYTSSISVRKNQLFGDCVYLGGSLSEALQIDIEENNLVNSKTIVIFKNLANKKITGEYGEVILVNCTNIELSVDAIIEIVFCKNITIRNCNASNGDIGIFIVYSNKIIVEDNSIFNNDIGIYIYHSTNVIIRRNFLQNDGIWFDVPQSDVNTIEIDETNLVNGKPVLVLKQENNVEIREDYGEIVLIMCSNVEIQTHSCIMLYSSFGIKINESNLSHNDFGIYSYMSSAIDVLECTLTNNSFGISLIYLHDAHIYGNTLAYNHWGIYIDIGSNNYYVCYNNFIKNGHNAYENPYSTGFWNNAYVGNYWDDYKGKDLNNDGIGDSPYRVSANSYDWKPLMQPANPKGDDDGDKLDNALEIYYNTNPLCNDTDSDGLPDGWEVMYNLNPLNSSDAHLDIDSDGLTNLEEYKYGTNPRNSDTDGDGMPDGWEVSNGLDPLNPSDATEDLDGDGLTNLEEYKYGTNPRNSDTDGDGYTDKEEILAGTDPCDPNDYPKQPEQQLPQQQPKQKPQQWPPLQIILAGVGACFTVILILIVLRKRRHA